MVTYKELIINSNKFKEEVIEFPTTDNILENRLDLDERLIEKQANSTRIIIHKKVFQLCKEYLELKLQFGTPIELEVYKNMSVDEFISRLFLKRPLAFLYRSDLTLLRDNTKLFNGFENWIKVGSLDEAENLKLKDYLSYQEMLISALLGVSVPTSFINDGNLHNQGVYAAKDASYTKEGVVVGLVGCRFERQEVMEYQTLACRMFQTTYADKLPTYMSELWARFYEVDLNNFNMMELVKAMKSNPKRYVKFEDGSNSILDLNLFEKRINLTLETFLLEANLRGKENNKPVYVRTLGLGLGVWLVNEAQKSVFVDTLINLLKTLDIPYIDTVEILHIRQNPPRTITTVNHNQLQVIFSKSFPASKIDENFLLVSNYPWDSNSFPGNEYWLGSLSASGDPAAACCSFLPQLQNPYINPFYENITVLE